MARKLSQSLTLAAGLAIFAVLMVSYSHSSFGIVFTEFLVILAVIALDLYFLKGK